MSRTAPSQACNQNKEAVGGMRNYSTNRRRREKESQAAKGAKLDQLEAVRSTRG